MSYGLKDPLANYESEINRLSMAECDRCQNYTAKFRTIAANLPDWSDRNLRNTYFQGVALRIRNQFISAARVPPATLEPLINVCDEFDTAYIGLMKKRNASRRHRKATHLQRRTTRSLPKPKTSLPLRIIPKPVTPRKPTTEKGDRRPETNAETTTTTRNRRLHQHLRTRHHYHSEQMAV